VQTSRILLGGAFPKLAEFISALPLEDHDNVCSRFLITVQFEKDSAGNEGLEAGSEVVGWMRYFCSRSFNVKRPISVYH